MNNELRERKIREEDVFVGNPAEIGSGHNTDAVVPVARLNFPPHTLFSYTRTRVFKEELDGFTFIEGPDIDQREFKLTGKIKFRPGQIGRWGEEEGE